MLYIHPYYGSRWQPLAGSVVRWFAGSLLPPKQENVLLRPENYFFGAK